MCLEYRTKQQREPFKYPFGSLNQFSIHQRVNEGRHERTAQENLSIVWIQSHSDKILHNFNSVTGKQHFFWQPLREQVWTSLDKSCLEIERIFLLYFHLQAKFKPSDKKCQNFETRQKRNFCYHPKIFPENRRKLWICVRHWNIQKPISLYPNLYSKVFLPLTWIAGLWGSS